MPHGCDATVPNQVKVHEFTTGGYEMSFELTDFLVSLAKPECLKKYSHDPEAFMSESRLSEQQKQAIRDGNLYRIRRLSAMEMTDSPHGQLLTRFYEEVDPEFKTNIDVGPQNVDDDTLINNDDSADTALGDDIAEFTEKYSAGPYFDHLFDSSWTPSKKNQLVIVGSGINGANHLTSEAIAHIKNADKVLYCVADLVVERHLLYLNRNAEDLYVLYGDAKPRRQTYEEMASRMLESVRQHERVCAVFYGHPGIFVWPSFKAIQCARKQGYLAYMLPAVSALDCLFADVGFDPSRHSCQIIEATDLLVRSRKPDITAAVVIFQVGCVGDLGWYSKGYDHRNVPVLEEYLISHYGPDYEVVLYEAAQYPVCKATVQKVKLSALSQARVSGITTLYIPPKELPPTRGEMLTRLGLKTLAPVTA
jgi:precorrin-2 methylase